MDAKDLALVGVEGLSLVNTGGGIVCGRLEMPGGAHVLVSLDDDDERYVVGLYDEDCECMELHGGVAASAVSDVVSLMQVALLTEYRRGLES